jgi:hypothetical protein
MSPNGTYASGVRFGIFNKGFLLNTSGTPAATNIPPLAGANQYNQGMAVNDAGNVVGYQRWSSGGQVTTVGWFYNRTAGTVTRLNTPFDANPSITAIPTALNSTSTYAFGSVDSDGPGGATAPVGGYWNVSTNAWAAITGVREVLDASADGLTLLVLDTAGVGKIIRGSVLGTYPTTIATFTGRLHGGKVSASGRYVGSSEVISSVPTPFVYDTTSSTRTNLPLLAADNQGAIVGAISDTARVLGTVYGSAAGSFSAYWLNPTSAYQSIANILSTDGHSTADPAYSSWNVYNGGGAISADGKIFGVFGNNPAGFEDSLLIKQICPAITVNPATLTNPTANVAYSATITATGGTSPYVFTLTSGSLPSGLTMNSSTGVISGTTSSGTTANFTITATDIYNCGGSRPYTLSPVVTDFGDWNGTGAATTTTNSTINSNLRLGATVDAELSVTPTATATADDVTNTGSVDDEDGATTLPATITKGTNSTLTLSVFNNTGANAFLHSWIDLNGDGTFNDGVVSTSPGERLEGVRTIATSATAQTVNITFSAPSWAVVGASRGVRLRLTNLNTTSPSGVSGSGEIEDYVTTIACPTILVNPASLTNPIQGLAYNTTLTAAGGNGAYSYAVTSGSVPAGLTLSSAGILSGTASGSGAAAFTVTATDAFGCTGSRAYTLTPVITDFGDWNGSGAATITATSNRNSNIRLGLTVDAETVVTPNAGATADDTTNTGSTDDEDGVTMPGSITKGASVTIPVSVFNNNVAGLQLQGWIDFNNDGTFNNTDVTSGGERIYNAAVAANAAQQTVNMTFTVPANASPGTQRGARFRFSNSATTTPTSTGASGEIEDYVTTIACSTITINPATLPDAYLNVPYSQTLTASGGNAAYLWSVSSGTLPAGLSLSSAGVISGTPTGTTSATFTVQVTDNFGCQATRAYTVGSRSMGIGNLVFVDMNNDGIRQTTESGVPGLAVQLWSPGVNGTRENGAGDDVQVGTTTFTDVNGQYMFLNLTPGVYYVRIQTPPTFYPSVSTVIVTTDNGINNDNNGSQPGGSGTQVVSPLITLAAGAEPAAGVDGDDTDRDSTIDFGFANTDPCYTNNLIDNPSFEFDGTTNSTGTAFVAMGYNGSGTSFGATNALTWLGGTNGSSGVGEPIQRVQVLAGNAGARVSWVESLKARHGKRYMLAQGTNSCVSLRAAGGGNWSTRLVAGREYELSAWAANASAASASVIWDFAHISGQVLQVISGPTPGAYQYYQVQQTEMTGTPNPFVAGNYNAWTEATANSPQPNWSRYTWRFRIMPGATTAQIDGLSLLLSAGPNSNPLVLDYVALCEVTASNTLALGSLVWNDANNNGIKDAAESGVSGATVQLYSSGDLVAGNGDDVLITSTTTSGTGIYSFTNRTPGRYVVRLTPTAGLPLTGGVPDTADNNQDNDNNGSQPGGSGTQLISPVITLATGTESVIDGDTNPDTELTIDFGLFSGFTVGNLVWNDVNNDGIYQSASESGISGVSVELLNGSASVVQSTTTNASGLYSFFVQSAGSYSVRIPTPLVSHPLASGIAAADNGIDNDNNGTQTGGAGGVVNGPSFTLAAGLEPGTAGTMSVENTMDFGFRACAAITINPTTLPNGTQYAAYSQNITASGGVTPYNYSITAGAVPTGLTLSSGGVLGGTITAVPGTYNFTVRAADTNLCAAARAYSLVVVCPTIAITPATLTNATQYATYSQTLTASGGTAAYSWTVSTGSLPTGMNLSTGGVLSGTPTSAPGAYTFTARAQDANLCVGTRSYTLTVVCPPISVNPATVPNATQYAPYLAQTFTATGGTSPYTYAISVGTLPTGMNLSSAGVLSGTPTSAPGAYNITVRATDANSCQGTRALTLTVICPPISVNPTTLPNGQQGVAYASQTFTAAGGTSPYTWSISAGALPTGLNLSTGGVLSGTPTAVPGTYNFTVRARDVNLCEGTRLLSIIIGCPNINIAPATLPNATQFVSYTQTLTATGGNSPYTWTVLTGSLPNGMSLSSGGVISGIPTSPPGNFTFTVRVTDAATCTQTRAYTLVLDCPIITITPATLPAATATVAYSQTLTATGGTAPYTWSMPLGVLPTGITLNATTGVISGTPTVIGSFTFTIRATDANLCTQQISYILAVDCPPITITPATLPAANWGSAYSQQLTATGGTPGYTWSLTSGTLPTGITLNSSTGLLSGTPTSAQGNYPISVRATDSIGCPGNVSYILTVNCPTIAITPTSLPTATVSLPYSQTMSSAGGLAPYSYLVTSGTLPAGLTLTSAGVLSGTPTSTANASFTIRSTDSNGCQNTRSYLLTPICPTLTVNPTSLPSGTVGTAYSQTLTASGTFAPYTWTVSSGTLPVGLTMNNSTGVISGTPTTSNGAGVNVTIRATGGGPCFGERVYNLKICPVITVNPTSLANGTVGTVYSQPVSATGGAIPYAFSVSNGSLPTGLTLASSTGIISGTPTSSASQTFTITATDANSCIGTRIFTVTPVCPVITVTPTTLANGLVGMAYSQTLNASGGTAPYTWTTPSGTWPAGLTLSGGGVLSGTPTASNGAGVNVTVRATDTHGCVRDQLVSIKICPVITVNPATLANGTVGLAYTQTVTATGGATPYTFAVSVGTLPTWATLNASTGAITGTPNSTSTASFTIRATDANGCTGTRAYTINFSCPVITVTQSALTAYISTAYSQTLTASGGTAPYGSWTVIAGTLPTGLTLSTAGVLSGTPSVIGSSTVTIRTTDAFACNGTRSITITVKGMTLGNQIWQDNDNDGLRDAGEPHIAGAQVILMNPGADNVIGGSSADTQVGSIVTTTSTGLYSFTNLPPANYYVRVIPPAGYTTTGGTPATTDNNVNDNNDGAQPGGIGTDLYSPVINLGPSAESITDGDTDNDTNLTLDFGLWAPLGVGNLVFIDLNGSGTYNDNEGIEGVYVQLFAQGANVATDEPVGVAFTDNKGRYYIDNILPGSYFLYLPASQFSTGAPLAGMITITTVVAGDDNAGQNLLNVATPATTGASTAVFTLSPGALPTGTAESGFEGFVDDAFIDANNDFTYDLGLRSPSGTGYPLAQRERNTLMTSPMTPAASKPALAADTTAATFADWSQLHEGEDDADLYPNLLEYALDTDPADGRSGSAAFRIVSTDLGHADVLLIRPANVRADIRYELQTSLDGLVWAASDLTLTITIGPDGRQIIRYNNVDEASIEPRGLLRLKVSLDSNLDGSAEHTAVSPTVMFSRETFAIGQRTFSMPLVKAELFAGNVSLEGNSITLPKAVTLTEGSHYYLEDLITGLSYEIDEAASTATEITLEGSAPAALTRVALREHQKLSQLLPADLFSEGDRVLTFDAAANSFTANPVTEDSTWTRDQLIGKTSGLMIQVREGSREVSQLFTGQVTVKPTPSTASGTRLSGSASAAEVSPADLGLNETKGFRASTETTEASRLRLWKADSDAEQTGYDQIYLSPMGWQRQDDATGTDLTKEKLLQPFRAYFLLP